MARGRKIEELPQRGNGSLHLDDKLPLVDSSGIAHHTSLQSIKDLLGTGGSSGAIILNGDDVSSHNLSDIAQFAILVDATTQGIECILPTPTLGKHYVFKKIDNTQNTITITTTDVTTFSFPPAGPGSVGQPVATTRQVKIDGEDEQILYQQYQSITVISDGDNWFIL